MKSLHEELTSVTKIPGGKYTEPKGAFKVWLESPEGKAALTKGIAVESEHTKDQGVAREIAVVHLKEDKAYYKKLAKVGLDEALYDDKTSFDHDTHDDLMDDDPLSHEDDLKMALEMAINAVRNPENAKRMMTRQPGSEGKLTAALNQIISRASQILKSMPKVATEAAMGFGGNTCVSGNPGDKGTGVPVMQPNTPKKMKFYGDKLKMGKPGKGMANPDAFTGTKSNFAKGTM